MATHENEVPEGVRDILAYMPHDIRQRVLADYESHYAPFLSMLAGWKRAVQQHYAFGEDAAIARLQEQFFPLGNWRFPAQTLAVPQRTPERTTDIAPESQFEDSSNRPWLSCGEGWAHPTALHQARIQLVDNEWMTVLDADYVGETMNVPDSLLMRGQLAFVAASEEFLAALNEAEWWVMTPENTCRPARFTRYDGYMRFERELHTARLNQRHLDLWLPACYPYSRKMVLMQLDTHSRDTPPDFGWLGAPNAGFRFIGHLRHARPKAYAAMRAQAQQTARGAESLFHLNAVPVAQTNLQYAVKYPTFPQVGDNYELRIAGQSNVYATVVYADNTPIPASMFRLPSNDPDQKEPDVVARFPQIEARSATLKIYFDAEGESLPDGSDRPGSLTMPPLRFTAPFRIMGGLNVNSPATREAWVREAWYQSVFRPPLLTEGDLAELIRQRRRPIGDMLRFRYATREIQHDPDEGAVHWRSYLWPTILPKEESFEAGYGEIPATNYIPLIQTLRIAFERGAIAGATPEFLLSDVANYLASSLSQYFTLSAFRVEGRVV